jgi:hypothetical protein
MRLCEDVGAPVAVRRLAVYTIGQLCRNLNFSDYASRIIHPLARVLDSAYLSHHHHRDEKGSSSSSKPQSRAADPLHYDVLDTLCVLVYHMGPSYAIFVPMIAKVIQRQNLVHDKYENLGALALGAAHTRSLARSLTHRLCLPLFVAELWFAMLCCALAMAMAMAMAVRCWLVCSG